MKSKLLTDEKYEEYLKTRDQPLTESQIRQLRKIDRAEIFINYYREELDDEIADDVLTVLRRRQMEILANETEKSWETVLNSLPDEINLNKIGLL